MVLLVLIQLENQKLLLTNQRLLDEGQVENIQERLLLQLRLSLPWHFKYSYELKHTYLVKSTLNL